LARASVRAASEYRNHVSRDPPDAICVFTPGMAKMVADLGAITDQTIVHIDARLLDA
jgi:hypothetical protein